MNSIDLDGAWTLKQVGKRAAINAAVPGTVHTDLLAAGLIPDPYYRDNEDRLQWIGEKDWSYSRSFDVSAEFLRHETILLRCEGLDTLATITVNSKKIASTDNMFRTWEFDISGVLKKGMNRIEVRFDSTLPYIEQRQAEHPIPLRGGPHTIPGGNWLRKEQCNYGWDWGPCLLTCGIWRSITLIGYDTARLGDIMVRQKHRRNGAVALDITADIETSRSAKGLKASITLSRNGNTVASAVPAVRNGKVRGAFTLESPELWWPSGMGDQSLYELQVDVTDGLGTRLDTVTKRIGLRTLKLVRKQDRWGESFRFEVNGVPFFAKGANWIPADTFAPRLTRDDYERLIGDAVRANMNMLRVWGGGIYEPDVFYDLCDELGICVWQDFMFACATYPAFDDDFMANVKAEVEDTVRRLRHHACIALWCGNNEMEQGWVGNEWNDRQMSWKDYSKLFDEMIPATVLELDPDGNYWPCSPHSPYGDRTNFNEIRWGDSHLWAVWHGKEPFEWYRTAMHRFCSEFGFQSFPEPRTVEGYTEPEDRNITSYVMEHHQRSGIGNTTIMTYMLDWFRIPSDFEMTVWASQILQGLAMKYAIEHWRRNMPRTMGTLYWQHNDCWPVASWSSIDYHHRWKALHFMAKRFFAPLLVSCVEDTAKGTVEIHVTSDRREACEGTVSWTVTTVAGETLTTGERTVTIRSGKNSRVAVVSCRTEIEKHGLRDLLVWADLTVAGERVSDNFISFAKPKHLELPEPDIDVSIREKGTGVFVITMRSSRPALWVWLEPEGFEAMLSDNFFHLQPEKKVEVEIGTDGRLSVDELKSRLKVRSLYDTYR